MFPDHDGVPVPHEKEHVLYRRRGEIVLFAEKCEWLYCFDCDGFEAFIPGDRCPSIPILLVTLRCNLVIKEMMPYKISVAVHSFITLLCLTIILN